MDRYAALAVGMTALIDYWINKRTESTEAFSQAKGEMLRSIFCNMIQNDRDAASRPSP